MIRRQLLAWFALPFFVSAQAEQQPPADSPSGWLAVVYCVPGAGAVQVTVSEGVQAQATTGQILGPVGLKPGTINLQARHGDKNISSPVELKKDQRVLALLVVDEKAGLAVKSMVLPSSEGKRLAIRLPGNGAKVWKAGKKDLPVGEAVEFTGRPMIKDADGAEVVAIEAEEPGVYLLVPSEDEGKTKVIFLP
ncbi:MAG: hypothetical protein ACKO2G_03710 [Verrucomicrobiales bacterium]